MFTSMTKRTIQVTNGELITPSEAARISGLTASWLARMADSGKLTVARPSGTHRRYLRTEIDSLAKPVTAKQ